MNALQPCPTAPALALALTLALLAPSAAAQQAFPLRVSALDVAAGRLELEPEAARIAALASRGSAELRGVALPDGSMVDLELERIDLERLQLGFRVDGAPAGDLLAGLDLSVWRGRVAGEPQSEALLAFSQSGCHGWIQRGGARHHLLSRAGADGSWAEPRALWVSDAALGALASARPFCSTALTPQGASSAPPKASPVLPPPPAASPPLYGVSVAIETDYQLFQVFGSLAAQTSYVTSLLAWVSDRYEEQIGTVLTYPYVQFYTTPADPWNTPDVGGNSVDMLFEFQAAWQNNVPAGALLGAFLSGANLGGGVAWLPGLCGEPYNFSVSGNIDGGVSFPVQPSSSNWDFMVLAHELGHNFGSPHTHDYCPPLDQCAPGGYFGQCQTSQVCTSQGTIMSYCHLCNGGVGNITTYFHPQNAADMRAHVESTCAPLHCADPATYCQGKLNSAGCVPAIDWSGHATLGGLDDLVVSATDVVNQKLGVLIWSYGNASTPFQGGTLCLAAPIVRTAPQASGGSALPANDCSGTFAYAWTHAYATVQGIQPGDTVFAQYWYRDPISNFGTGLSDALRIPFCQ